MSGRARSGKSSVLLARSVALSTLLVAAGVLAYAPGSSAAPDRTAAAGAEDVVFRALSDSAVAARKPDGVRLRVRVAPEASRAFEVDLAGLRTVLAAAPTARQAARGASPARVALPDPSGRLVEFAVQEQPVMQAGLAAAHPELRTYAGHRVDDPSQTLALDVTPLGVHASVRDLDQGASWLLDPAYQRRAGTTDTVLSYLGAALPDGPGLVEEDPLRLASSLGGPTGARPRTDAGRGDGSRTAPGALVTDRTYRLALLTDPSYATYFGTQNVLAEKVTLMTRVNQIYNDDFGITMLLVDGTDRLNLDTAAKATGANGPCGANACFEPADLESCGSGTLDRNAFVLGQVLGADEFDIGHIGLGVNGGGIAGLGVVGSSSKASGCTGIPTPEGDFYAIDYVAHEMGHQFNGNHTFNGTLGACSGLNRNGGTSVEPGSGSSVMAYAGICAADDLQPHTDPYFSQRSLDEVDELVTATPGTYDEVQSLAVTGFDAAGETLVLAAGGKSAEVTRGALSGLTLAADVADAVEAVTGFRPQVTGYDGDPSLADGFTLTFGDALGVGGGSAVDVPQVVASSTSPGVSAISGTLVQGGPGGNQGTVTTGANHAPSVTAPADKTLPVRTPFTLTGSGSDVDGDPLTYLWEQNDEGGTSGTQLTSNTKTSGPLFRVFGTYADVTDEGALLSPSPGQNVASGVPSRTFPDLAQVLAGTTNAATGSCPAAPSDTTAVVPRAVLDCYSEFLPTAAYGSGLTGTPELNFRLTARDADPATGGTAHDDVRLTLATSAGPFLVTSRATAGTPAQGGATETVTWAVNGTDAAALAPKVRILLSTDGGATFDRVLAASTANDGSEAVVLPAVGTTKARLKIEAVDNYFFDVNDADFTIEAPLAIEVPSALTGTYSDEVAGDTAARRVTVSATGVDGDQVTAALAGLEGLRLAPVSTSADGVRPGTATFEVVGRVGDAAGERTGTVTVTDGPVTGTTGSTTGGHSASAPLALTVSAETVRTAWSGDTRAVRPSSGDPVARLATTLAPTDDTPGDATRATVTFVDADAAADAPDRVLCTARPTVDAAGTARAACTAPLDADDDQARVETVVSGGYYVRDPGSAADVTTISIVDAPQTRITAGPAAFVLADRVAVRVASSADDATYACTVDGRARTCAPGTNRFTGFGSGTHRIDVTATDAEGVSDPTPATRQWTVPMDDRFLTRGSGWTVVSSATTFRGRYLEARRTGATLTREVRGATRLAVVVDKGPGFGELRVYAGSRPVGTVDLDAPRRFDQATVVLPALDRPFTGTVTLRTLSGERVRVDGLGVTVPRG